MTCHDSSELLASIGRAAERRGQGGQCFRGPWSLGGPLASGWPLTLVTVKTFFFFFFFWRSPYFGRKKRLNFGEDLFFFIGGHIIILTKL